MFSKPTKQFLFDWIPFMIIVLGIVANQLKADPHAYVMFAGFFLYGISGLVQQLRLSASSKKFGRILKLIVLTMIGLIAVLGFLGDPTYFIALLALVLLDKIILTTARLESMS